MGVEAKVVDEIAPHLSKRFPRRNQFESVGSTQYSSTACGSGDEQSWHGDVRSPWHSGLETVACEAGGATVGQHERGSLRGWCGGTENV